MEQGKRIYAEGEKVEYKKLTLAEHIKALGPGIVFVLTAMGAGDIVDSSVSGSHYGYALMWVLAVAILVRFVIVNIMARFDMCNTEGITLLQGYGRLHKAFPWFFIIFSLFCGHMTNATMISGSGNALYNLTGVGNVFIWACIAVAASFFVAGKNIQRYLENIMKVLLALMTIAFLALAIMAKPDPVEIFKGIFTFEMPAGMGLFSATTIMLALIGSVAGSMTNFLYPHSIRAKGWTDPTWKKVQRGDLLFSIIMMIVINLAVWIVGAEVLAKNGIEVQTLDDLAAGMEITFGRAGSVLLYPRRVRRRVQQRPRRGQRLGRRRHRVLSGRPSRAPGEIRQRRGRPALQVCIALPAHHPRRLVAARHARLRGSRCHPQRHHGSRPAGHSHRPALPRD